MAAIEPAGCLLRLMLSCKHTCNAGCDGGGASLLHYSFHWTGAEHGCIHSETKCVSELIQSGCGLWQSFNQLPCLNKLKCSVPFRMLVGCGCFCLCGCPRPKYENWRYLVTILAASKCSVLAHCAGLGTATWQGFRLGYFLDKYLWIIWRIFINN